MILILTRFFRSSQFKELEGELVTLLFYLTFDDNGKGVLQPIRIVDSMDAASKMDSSESLKHMGLSGVDGRTGKLGDFQVRFHHNEESQIVHTAYLSRSDSSPHLLKTKVQEGMRLREDKRKNLMLVSLVGDGHLKKDTDDANLVVHQVTGKLPFELEVVYESQSVPHRERSLRGEWYDSIY